MLPLEVGIQPKTKAGAKKGLAATAVEEENGLQAEFPAERRTWTWTWRWWTATQ